MSFTLNFTEGRLPKPLTLAYWKAKAHEGLELLAAIRRKPETDFSFEEYAVREAHVAFDIAKAKRIRATGSARPHADRDQYDTLDGNGIESHCCLAGRGCTIKGCENSKYDCKKGGCQKKADMLPNGSEAQVSFAKAAKGKPQIAVGNLRGVTSLGNDPALVLRTGMCDIFDTAWSVEFIDHLLSQALINPYVVQYFLTKNPKYGYKFLTKLSRFRGQFGEPKFANLVIGISASFQESFDKRADWMVQWPIQNIAVSLRPLLGPVVLPRKLLADKRLVFVHGSGRRPGQTDHMRYRGDITLFARNLARQCMAAKVDWIWDGKTTAVPVVRMPDTTVGTIRYRETLLDESQAALRERPRGPRKGHCHVSLFGGDVVTHTNNIKKGRNCDHYFWQVPSNKLAWIAHATAPVHTCKFEDVRQNIFDRVFSLQS